MGYSRRRVTASGQVRFTAYYCDVRGRERSAGTFGRQCDADRAWRREEASAAEGRFVDVRSGRQVFERYVLDVWLVGHAMEPTTRQGYTQIIEQHLLGEFGSMRMNEILPIHVREFLARLRDQGSSVHTVQKCKTVLGAIFSTALHDQVIRLHPCDGVRILPVPVLPLRVLMPVELDAILRALPSWCWQMLVETAIETGLRWGELTELRVADLDPSTRMLTVSRTSVELRPRFHPQGGRFMVKPYPKDREFRCLVLRRHLVDRLVAYVGASALAPTDLLFAMPDEVRQSEITGGTPEACAGLTEPNTANRQYRHGTLAGYSMGGCRCNHCRMVYAQYRAVRRAEGKDRPPVGRPLDTDGHVSRNWFLKQIWKPALAEAGITRRMRMHDLRHAHASWLLAGGADLQMVRERLGHASLRSTERYLHTLPDSDDRTLAAFSRIRDGEVAAERRPVARVVRMTRRHVRSPKIVRR